MDFFLLLNACCHRHSAKSCINLFKPDKTLCSYLCCLSIHLSHMYLRTCSVLSNALGTGYIVTMCQLSYSPKACTLDAETGDKSRHH